MSANTYSSALLNDQQAYLKSLIKTRTIQAQIVNCARMLLWKFEAKPDKTIADNLSVTVNTVHRYITRYNLSEINIALFGDERSGHPLEITDDAKAWIIRVACQKPCELGYAAELWTLAVLHFHIQEHSEEAGYHCIKTVTKLWLQNCLKRIDIKPFKSSITMRGSARILKTKYMIFF